MPTILVIDDNASVCDALDLLFSLHDMQTLSASTPEAGLAMLEREDVDLVIGSKLDPASDDKRPFVRRLATRVFNLLLRVILDSHVSDTHGMKGFRRKLVDDLALLDESFAEHREHDGPLDDVDEQEQQAVDVQAAGVLDALAAGVPRRQHRPETADVEVLVEGIFPAHDSR